MAKRVIIELEVDPGTGLATIKNFGNTFETEMGKVARSTKSAASSLQLLKFDAIVRFAERAFHYTQQIYSFGKSIASLTNDIERNSRTLGLSIAEYQKWTYAAKMADVSQEDLITGWKFLSRNIEDAKRGVGEARKYFEALGIKLTDTADVSLQLADHFKAAGESGEQAGRKIDYAMALAGRGGISMVPMWNLGSKANKDYMDEAVKLGTVLGDVVVKKGGEAEATFKKMEAQINATKLSLAPAALAFANFFAAVLEGAKKVQELEEGFWEKLLKKIGVPKEGLLGKKPEIFFPIENRLPIEEVKLPSIGPQTYEQKYGMSEEELKSRLESSKLMHEQWMEGIVTGSEVQYTILEEVYQNIGKGIMKLTQVAKDAWGVIGLSKEKGIPDLVEQIGAEIEQVNREYEALGIAALEANEKMIMAWDIPEILADIEKLIAKENELGEAAVNRQELQESTWKMQKVILKETFNLAKSIGTAFDKMFDGMIAGTLKAKDAFKSFFLSIGRDYINIFLKNTREGLEKWINNLFSGKTTTASTGQVATGTTGTSGGGGGGLLGFLGLGGQMGGAGGGMGSLLGGVAAVYSAYSLFSGAGGQKMSQQTGAAYGAAYGAIIGAYFGNFITVAIGAIIGGIYGWFTGSSGDAAKRRAVASIQRYKTYFSMQAMGFDIPLNEKGTGFDLSAIREQGGLLGIPTPHVGKKRTALWEAAQELYKSITEDFAGALSAGLKVGSFKTFEKSLRNSIYENVFEGMVQAFTRASALREVLTPIYQFIYEGVANALTKGFDIIGFKTGIEERYAKLTPVLEAMTPLFEAMYGATSSLRGEITGGSRVTIPSFQKGGEMPWTGLALVHKGEKILTSGKDGGVTVYINNPVISNDMDINDVARKLGRQIDWERRRAVAYG